MLEFVKNRNSMHWKRAC